MIELPSWLAYEVRVVAAGACMCQVIHSDHNYLAVVSCHQPMALM
jgi:hypothetical protein